MASYPPLVALTFVKDKINNLEMGKRRNDLKKINANQNKKSEDAFRFSKDRIQLLDTIHKMVSDELQLRGLEQKRDPHPENPPPKVPGETSNERRTRPSLLQRIKRILRDNMKSSPTE